MGRTSNNVNKSSSGIPPLLGRTQDGLIRKTKVGQKKDQTKSLVTGEEWLDKLNERLVKLFENVWGDVEVQVTYYGTSKSAYINITKQSGSQMSINFALSPTLIKAFAEVFATIGEDSEDLIDAFTYMEDAIDRMKTIADQ